MTADYILSGETRICYGDRYEKTVDLGLGDLVSVPPFVARVERNVSDDLPVKFVAARIPTNITVNLSDHPDIPLRYTVPDASRSSEQILSPVIGLYSTLSSVR